jgi:hypothetical protein
MDRRALSTCTWLASFFADAVADLDFDRADDLADRAFAAAADVVFDPVVSEALGSAIRRFVDHVAAGHWTEAERWAGISLVLPGYAAGRADDGTGDTYRASDNTDKSGATDNTDKSGSGRGRR